ncbi:RagB/SusD family nutrient uptake outer membrane protein [Ferruginibacter paludis]|uniref:RagB/SusD family nutrient uptake outer membrane protein n=1 Tax=Ferruginibacter paludis TaxID=1310417 RepID=UPI0025B4F337|nr:RagB/SusD family nutrient uptake outer membrane protein [Ferruginibacter paludis]MDN3655158.1 RagB/SusD family nutrient uptake outer membrane protein [Ferruginibacter paludis]
MKQHINKAIIATALVLTGTLGCNKKLNVFDENNPTTLSYFKTASELQNGVNAIYSTLRSGELVGREWFFTHDMRGGEAASGGPQLEAPRAELLSQPSPAPSNAVMSNVWSGCYQMINRANLVLDKAPAITDNTALRDRVVGETKFLRGWAYFELVAQWGDVPMYTQPVASSTDFKGKSPAADIYALIISDLTAAAEALPESYGPSDNGRATKGAANSLLGKVLMQKGDYDAAKTALLKVYGKYTLAPNYQWNFDGDIKDDNNAAVASGHEFNSESIFEVVFVDKGDNNFNWGYNGEGSTSPLSTVRNQEYGITWGNVIPSNQFLNEFEANDPRYKFTIFEEGDTILKSGPGTPLKLTADMMNIAASTRNGSTKKRFFRKYNIYDYVNSGFHPGGINQRVIRYADILLLLAECEAEVGTPAQAASYINEVRSRPGVNMPPVTLASKNDALKAVMHERTVELGAEELASFDILRWRKKGYFPSIIPERVPGQVDLFPIPAIETSTNPLIK